MQFSIGQYNILAADLAQNLKPWFWYGYHGVTKGMYIDDGMDEIRREVLGEGRSEVLIGFWSMAKTFFKIFANNEGFDYDLHRARLFPEQNRMEYMQEKLFKAMVDFFDRTDQGPEGFMDLSCHLFARKSSQNYMNWDALASHVGLRLNDDDWGSIDVLRDEIIFCEDATKRTGLIEDFNEHLKIFLTEGKVEEFPDRIRNLAKLICLNEDDIHELLNVQKTFDWENRCDDLISLMKSMNAPIWCVEELDEITDFQRGLEKYRLAIHKQRKVNNLDDGVAIFFDPDVFELVEVEGNPRVTFLRYSGKRSLSYDCELQTCEVRYRDGIAYSESLTVIEDSVALRGYAFTNKLELVDLEFYDERVAVFAQLRHIESGNDILVISTHLEHSQKDPIKEQIRRAECQQLSAGLKHILSDFGFEENELPIIVAGDFNDVRNYSDYDPNKTDRTPFYNYLMETGWLDSFKGSSPPTTYTLSRKYCIDYIFIKESNNFSVITTPHEVPLLYLGGLNEKGEKILIKNEEEKSVYGFPMGPIQNQPLIPSDHLPIMCNITFLPKQN